MVDVKISPVYYYRERPHFRYEEAKQRRVGEEFEIKRLQRYFSKNIFLHLYSFNLLVALIHGDLEQTERNKVITSFKKKEVPILVATDVAARGLDIPSIRTVVNYDVARDIDTHTHRIGRTGRAGEKGNAFTLLTSKDKDFAGHLVRNLESVDQEVPNDLLNLAMQNPWFKKNRFKQGKAKKVGLGGAGLGYRVRPGLGCPKISGSDGMGSSSSVGGMTSTSPSTFGIGSVGGEKTNRLSSLKSAFSVSLEYYVHFNFLFDIQYR